MLPHQKQSLITAKELYPSAEIDDLIIIAKKIENTYHNSDPYISLIYFCQLTKIQHATNGLIDFKLYDYQKQYLLKLLSNKNILTISARQMGNTELLSKFALWKATHNTNHKISVFSNTFTSVTEIKNRIEFAIHNIKDSTCINIIKSNKSCILFSNGSEITFSTLPDKEIDKNINTMIIDNAAHISHSIFEAFWKNNYDKLNENNCQIILNSSAGYSSGLFFDLYVHTLDNWITYTMKWNLHPDRDINWMHTVKANIGNELFDKEYNCLFINR